jgi:hypothetical protein
MLENSSCNILCHADIPGTTDEYEQGDAGFINERIVDGYSLNWLIDGLPAARIRVDPQSSERFYSVGFELGSFDSSGLPLLNNHYDIIVEFHVPPPTPDPRILSTRLFVGGGCFRGGWMELMVVGGERSTSSGGVYCSAFESGDYV